MLVNLKQINYGGKMTKTYSKSEAVAFTVGGLVIGAAGGAGFMAWLDGGIINEMEPDTKALKQILSAEELTAFKSRVEQIGQLETAIKKQGKNEITRAPLSEKLAEIVEETRQELNLKAIPRLSFPQASPAEEAAKVEQAVGKRK